MANYVEVVDNQFAERVLVICYKVATILVGFGLSFLGYRLFKSGIWGDSGNVEGNFGNWKLVVKNAAPGLYFTICGTLVIIYTVLKGGTFHDKVDRRDNNNGIKVEDCCHDTTVINLTINDSVGTGSNPVINLIQPNQGELKNKPYLEIPKPMETKPMESLTASYIRESITHYNKDDRSGVMLVNKTRNNVEFEKYENLEWVRDTLKPYRRRILDVDKEKRICLVRTFDREIRIDTLQNLEEYHFKYDVDSNLVIILN